jgi:hypothetical protein
VFSRIAPRHDGFPRCFAQCVIAAKPKGAPSHVRKQLVFSFFVCHHPTRFEMRFPGKALILTMSLVGVLLPHRAAAQTLLIDTGSPTNPAGGTSLGATGAKNCSPPPSCGQSFQFWAGQFTLAHAATITSVQGWMGAIFTGGSLAVKIYADGGGIPGTALYAQTYNVPSGFVDGWFPFAFSNPNPSLTAGTYWLAFERLLGARGQG